MPRIKIQALTSGWVKRATKPGAYSDGYGLTLRIDARGNKRWVQRLTIRRRQRNLGLGVIPRGVAGGSAGDGAGQLASSQGRSGSRSREAHGQGRRPTCPSFEDVARRVVALRRPTWSNDKHAAQWENSLATYVFPVIGRLPVDVLSTNDVLTVLEPIWNAKPETATRVRQRMEVVFDYAIASGWRVDNPAVVVKKVLPRRRGQQVAPSGHALREAPSVPRRRSVGPQRTRSPGWGWSS